jgi:hypothetical protein
MLFVSAGGGKAAVDVVDIGDTAGALHVSIADFELGNAGCYDPNEVSVCNPVIACTNDLPCLPCCLVPCRRPRAMLAVQERRLRAAIAAAPGGVSEFERAIRALSASLGGGKARITIVANDGARIQPLESAECHGNLATVVTDL